MDDKECRYGSGSGSTRCYVVEARSNLNRPIVLTDGRVLDHEWRRLHFDAAPIGVKVQTYCRFAEVEGYLDYAAAMALARWVIANASEQSGAGFVHRAIGVQTRLVAVDFSYSYSAKEVGVGPRMTDSERDPGFRPRSESAVLVDAVDPVVTK